MSKSKSIIPEFMVDNPTDIFKILFPLRLRLDDEDYSQSHFDVVVKNMTQKEIFYMRCHLNFCLLTFL